MSEIKTETSDVSSQPQRGCNVNSAFNFTVGALAIAAGALIGYFVYLHWWK